MRTEILDNYFDLPVLAAAERYAASEEFAEVIRLLGPGNGKQILDLGAGNGIASFALAKNGWHVTALRTRSSAEVGAAAIEAIRDETGLPITIVREGGKTLPFEDRIIRCDSREPGVASRPRISTSLASELFRVLRPGGLCLTTREHLADDERQLNEFRIDASVASSLRR